MSWLTQGPLEELKGTLKERLADPGVTYSLSKTQDTSAVEQEQPGFLAVLNFAMQHQPGCRLCH